MAEKPKIESSKDLRDFLIAQMVNVADGTIDVPEAKCVCNLSQQIYNSVSLEIKAYKVLQEASGDLSQIPSVKF